MVMDSLHVIIFLLFVLDVVLISVLIVSDKKPAEKNINS